ncbi:MAG TPA: hypothetical protein VJU86_16360 [Pyrinomonadaceae bacterium]|nr:hypothetical protein [Pyrinomonadaceae bacterium]
MSVDPNNIKDLESKIIDGTIPRCPLCAKRIVVGKKQAGESGAVGFQYRCSDPTCKLPPGHAYIPWQLVLLRALQKRAVQIALAAIGSITITGILGFSTGVIKWKSSGDTVTPTQSSDSVFSKHYGDSNDFLKNKDTGLFSYVSKAQQEIWFVGIAFHVTLSDGDTRKLILRKLEEGVSVKFLIYDPTSTNVSLVAQHWGRDSSKHLLSDCGTGIRYLSEIYETAKNRHLKQNLEVKLSREIPQSRVYIFDRHDTNSYTFFIPHVGRYRSPELPGYLYKNDSIAREYRDAVINLWNSKEDAGIITFEAWLDRPETKVFLGSP